MKSLHNIEKSGFHRGRYVGYGAGHVWRVTKINSAAGKWQARCLTVEATAHDKLLFADTLESLSASLEAVDLHSRAVQA